MNLFEAMQFFKINSKEELTEELVKKRYRSYCFMHHPDAHPFEDSEVYERNMIQTNEAYEVLKQHIYLNSHQNSSYNEAIKQREMEQIEKEKILTEIIVRAYYMSKEEIDIINADFLDYFLSIPQQVGKATRGNRKPVIGYRHITEAFSQKTEKESIVMNNNIKKLALEFADKYNIKIHPFEVVSDEYINFLNNTNWYENYKELKAQERDAKIRLE